MRKAKLSFQEREEIPNLRKAAFFEKTQDKFATAYGKVLSKVFNTTYELLHSRCINKIMRHSYVT